MKQSNVEEKKDSEQIDTSKKDEEPQNEGKILIKRNLRQYDPAPEIEWWDAAFLPPDNSYGDEIKKFPYPEISEKDIHIGMITNYIQHPKKLKNEYIENINKMVVPIHLTEKEKKRLRRIKRVDKEKDK
jgi:U4/U6 small nuclear ribonucleoprotein PRP3